MGRTSTYALTNVTLAVCVQIAKKASRRRSTAVRARLRRVNIRKARSPIPPSRTLEFAVHVVVISLRSLVPRESCWRLESNQDPMTDDSEERGSADRQHALTAQVQGLLESAFDSVWIDGEIGSLSHPGSGHLFFHLKDKAAIIQQSCARSDRLPAAFAPRSGRRSSRSEGYHGYPPRGRINSARTDVPQGVGAWEPGVFGSCSRTSYLNSDTSTEAANGGCPPIHDVSS